MTTTRKIIANDAIVTSKLSYGRETTNLTKDQLRRLNAFQPIGLKRILNLFTTFINRENTNDKVYKMAEEKSVTAVKALTDRYMLKKVKLFGHSIRTHQDDPFKVISFDNTKPWLRSKRAICLPRQGWFERTYNYA